MVLYLVNLTALKMPRACLSASAELLVNQISIAPFGPNFKGTGTECEQLAQDCCLAMQRPGSRNCDTWTASSAPCCYTVEPHSLIAACFQKISILSHLQESGMRWRTDTVGFGAFSIVHPVPHWVDSLIPEPSRGFPRYQGHSCKVKTRGLTRLVASLVWPQVLRRIRRRTVRAGFSAMYDIHPGDASG